MRGSFTQEYAGACDRMRRIAVLGVLDIAARDGATASIVTFYEGGPECFVACLSRGWEACTVAEFRTTMAEHIVPCNHRGRAVLERLLSEREHLREAGVSGAKLRA